MSDPKKQHYIPACYLRQFVDPLTPEGQEPYVWMFDKKNKKGKKRAPKNILTSNNLYTINISGDKKDYTIEKTLSRIEGEYIGILNNKIKKHLPLTDEEHIAFCIFVVTMLQRTLRQKENIERFMDEVIGRGEEMAQANNARFDQADEWRRYKVDMHKKGVLEMVPKITDIIYRMGLAFMYPANDKLVFITSDDPCGMFNPDLQWQRFYGPGLMQNNIQLTLPLTPKVSACFSWTNFKGYIQMSKWWTNEINRHTYNQSHKVFIHSSSKIKRSWFTRYPISLSFMLKVLLFSVKRKLEEYKFNRKYGK
jgi:hypothetical protein